MVAKTSAAARKSPSSERSAAAIHGTPRPERPSNDLAELVGDAELIGEGGEPAHRSVRTVLTENR